MSEPNRCHHCARLLPTYSRFTLPRAKTGDLVFCTYACQELWRAEQAKS